MAVINTQCADNVGHLNSNKFIYQRRPRLNSFIREGPKGDLIRGPTPQLTTINCQIV